MASKIRGWQVMNLDAAILFYELCEKYKLTSQADREKLADTMFKKVPQERLEAMFEGKKVVYIKSKERK